jgi:excinuclease ABC subunit C
MDQSDSKLAEPKLRDATGPGQLASEVWVGQEVANKASSDKAERTESGFDVIAAFVKKLPNTPGVYRMLNDKGDVLYVGKARQTQGAGDQLHPPHRPFQPHCPHDHATAAMEFISTRTETEALLLEANLIKRLRPRFNVLLRDDKSFPYILMAEQHEAAQLVKHRGARNSQGSYFGPFASAGAVGRTINALQKAF